MEEKNGSGETHFYNQAYREHQWTETFVQQVTNPNKIEWYEAIHIHRNYHKNLLNADKGSVSSPILKLFEVKRKLDQNVIDLALDSPDSSIDETFFDCEWFVNVLEK